MESCLFERSSEEAELTDSSDNSSLSDTDNSPDVSEGDLQTYLFEPERSPRVSEKERDSDVNSDDEPVKILEVTRIGNKTGAIVVAVGRKNGK